MDDRAGPGIWQSADLPPKHSISAEIFSVKKSFAESKLLQGLFCTEKFLREFAFKIALHIAQ